MIQTLNHRAQEQKSRGTGSWLYRHPGPIDNHLTSVQLADSHNPDNRVDSAPRQDVINLSIFEVIHLCDLS